MNGEGWEKRESKRGEERGKRRDEGKSKGNEKFPHTKIFESRACGLFYTVFHLHVQQPRFVLPDYLFFTFFSVQTPLLTLL